MDMKKSAYILYIAALLSAALSCSRQADLENPAKYTPAEGKALFSFTPDFGALPETKALAETPDIRNIYIAVFDGTGHKITEYVEAKQPTSYAKENTTSYQYSVELTVTDEPRVIHVIANAPEKLSFGAETEIIGNLLTGYDSSEYDCQDAYWARIELPDGIAACPVTGDSDYDAKYARYEDVVNKLDGAKLIRNFAKVTVVNSASNFQLDGFWLINYPDRGSIAPYNRETGAFQSDYSTYDNIDDILASDKGNYSGFLPATAQLLTSFGSETMVSDQAAGAAGYVYERDKATADPLYVIIEGRYRPTDSTDNFDDLEPTFYKIDFRDDDGEYFPILRNFNYRVNIRTVSRDGSQTKEGALAAAASGDISTSLDTKDLKNISDGTSRIFVEETDVVLVSDDEVRLRYKYIPDLSRDENSDGEADVCNGTAENEKGYVELDCSVHGSTGEVFDSITVSTSDDADGYRTVILKPKTPGTTIRTQDITVIGRYKDSSGKWQKISRTVTYRLREKMSIKVSCSPTSIPETSGSAIDVLIGLEAGLPSNIFSLDFTIEVKDLTLTPNGEAIPIRTGSSTIPGREAMSAFYFIKTITWDEYNTAAIKDGYKYFSCHFKSNAAVSASTVYVSNKYFNQANASFTNYIAKHFNSISWGSSPINTTTEVDGKDVPTEVTVSYTMDDFTDWASSYRVYVAMDNLEKAASDGVLHAIDPSSDEYAEFAPESGYELYYMDVTSTSNSFTVSPVAAGTGRIMLIAKQYTSMSSEVTINSGAIIIIVDQNDFVTLVGTDYTGAGCPVRGQQYYLTCWINSNEATDVTIDGVAAERTANTATEKNGYECYPYRTTSPLTATTTTYNKGEAQDKTATYSGKSATGTVKVYGIDLVRETSGYNTSDYYTISSSESSGYLYSNNGSLATNGSAPYTLNTNYYFKFGSEYKQDSWGSIQNIGSGKYISGGTNTSGNLSQNSKTWYWTSYNYKFGFYLKGSGSKKNTKYYFRGTDKANTTATYYYIYKVTFKAPE